nr:drug resistance protein [Quercus suber]
MIGGRLGDIFGQRFMLIIGTTLFNISTLICALVNDDIGLVVGRAFQGEAKTTTPSSFLNLLAIDKLTRMQVSGPHSPFQQRNHSWLCHSRTSGRVLELLPSGERVGRLVLCRCSSASALESKQKHDETDAPLTLTHRLGPILGGLFTSLVTWQWIFWFSLIVEGVLEVAALGLLFTNRLPAAVSAPTEEGTDAPISIFERIDILGSSVSVAGLILLVFALSEGNVVGWDTVEVIVTLVLAVLLIAIFLFLELKVAKYPILPRYFWADRIRMLGCIAAALTYAVWQGTNYHLTLQLQGLGFSALSTAVRFLPLGITAIVVNIVAPIVVKFVSPRPLLIGGWALGLGGVLLLSFIKSPDDYWRFCAPGEILYIAGIGTVNFVGNITVVATAKKEFQGTVSGIFNMFLNVKEPDVSEKQESELGDDNEESAEARSGSVMTDGIFQEKYCSDEGVKRVE